MDGLDTVDAHGNVPYACGSDQAWLEPVDGDPGVFRCPTCAHRTDEPGDGVLGDGFDIVHRQWGLRGDPHAWWAMRDAIGATPTPPSADAVRTAYVAAFQAASLVDLEHEQEQKAYRKHLDHGGMSGGWVDVGWWRTKGIPLLVERALDRRPSEPLSAAHGATPALSRPPGGGRVVGVLVWLIVLAIPAALVGGGGYLLYQRASGTRVDATVLECGLSGSVVVGSSTYREDCVATWTIDGRVVTGPFVGGNGERDVGDTVPATVRDGTAYSRSLGLPILLIALGLPFLALPALAGRARRRARGAAAT